MTDKEYIENIDKVDTDTLFENLEYYGFDSYYRDLWYATIGELKKRIEIRPKGEYKFHTYMPHKPYCSNCEHDSQYGRLYDFCPNCGADMRGGAE